MKRWIAAIILALLLMFAVHASAAEQKTCSAGSYQIDVTESGSPICKTTPTGCPYGDSVPLGDTCYKLAPKTSEKPLKVAEDGDNNHEPLQDSGWGK